jgi:hypothetical protein
VLPVVGALGYARPRSRSRRPGLHTTSLRPAARRRPASRVVPRPARLRGGRARPLRDPSHRRNATKDLRPASSVPLPHRTDELRRGRARPRSAYRFLGHVSLQVTRHERHPDLLVDYLWVTTSAGQTARSAAQACGHWPGRPCSPRSSNRSIHRTTAATISSLKRHLSPCPRQQTSSPSVPNARSSSGIRGPSPPQ